MNSSCLISANASHLVDNNIEQSLKMCMRCPILYVRLGAAFSRSHGDNDIQQGEIWVIQWSQAEAVTGALSQPNYSSQKSWGPGALSSS